MCGLAPAQRSFMAQICCIEYLQDILVQDFCIESMCMSGHEIKRTGRKTVHLALVALNVGTWTQICMHACKQGLWACSDSSWGLLLRPQILFQKRKNCWYLWETMPWSLQSLQFLDSSWWMKMLNRSDRHRLGAAPRQASSARKGATKIATWTWFRIASMRPENLTNLNICHQFKPWLLGIESFWLGQVIRNWFGFCWGAVFLNQLMAFAAVIAPALLALKQTKTLKDQLKWLQQLLLAASIPIQAVSLDFESWVLTWCNRY